MIYKDILKKALTSSNPPNLLFSCRDQSYSYQLIKDYLHKRWPHFQLRKISERGQFEYYKYSCYYEFSLEKMQTKQGEAFWEILNGLLSQGSVTGERYWIVLKGDESIKKSYQDRMRFIIERHQCRATFLLLTNNESHIIDPLKSRFLIIRIPIIQKPIQYNIYDKICDHIIEIITHDFDALTKDKLHKIKDISHDILKYNLSISLLLRTLLEKCIINNRWIADIKYKIVALIADYEIKIRSSYRTMIYLESLFIDLYYISFAHYKIN